MGNDLLMLLYKLFTSFITCWHKDEDGALSILDGQHRVGMIKLLAEKNDQDSIDWDKILVEVFSLASSTNTNSTSDQFASDLFVEINKAEPLKLVDMPGVAKESERRIVTEAAEHLKSIYPEMFSASQNCLKPHLNVDNLRDALFKANILKRHDLSTSKKLVAWLLEQNQNLTSKYQNPDDQTVKGISARALTKAQKFDFYLGLESLWMYD